MTNPKKLSRGRKELPKPKCTWCFEEIVGQPFAPKWMLGNKFCDKKCAEKSFNSRKASLVVGLDKMLAKANQNYL